MPEPIKEGDGKGGTPAPEPKIEDLVKQIENLNKGISSTRDEAKSAREEARVAKERADKFEKDLEESKKPKEPEVKLSEEDKAKFNQFAKDNGLASKADLEMEKIRIAQTTLKSIETQAINEFTEKHPEYIKDEEWAKIKSQFEMYRPPSTLQGFRQILDKIHKDLNGGKDSEDAKAAARAELHNRSRLGLGRGANSTTPPGEETVDSLQKRYPSLGREQIESRLAELQKLYPKK